MGIPNTYVENKWGRASRLIPQLADAGFRPPSSAGAAGQGARIGGRVVPAALQPLTPVPHSEQQVPGGAVT